MKGLAIQQVRIQVQTGMLPDRTITVAVSIFLVLDIILEAEKRPQQALLRERINPILTRNLKLILKLKAKLILQHKLKELRLLSH